MNKKTIRKRKTKRKSKTIKGGRLAKWKLITYTPKQVKYLKDEELRGYAKLYNVKPPKGEPPYSDKEIINRLKYIIKHHRKGDEIWRKCYYKNKGPDVWTKYKFRNSYSGDLKEALKRSREFQKKYKKEFDKEKKHISKISKDCKRKEGKYIKKNLKKGEYIERDYKV